MQWSPNVRGHYQSDAQRVSGIQGDLDVGKHSAEWTSIELGLVGRKRRMGKTRRLLGAKGCSYS